MPPIHGREPSRAGRSRGPTCRFIHSWVHSWGQSSIDVVTPLVSPSHPSHSRRLRRSVGTGPLRSLHTRWTTLGAERHVDLWTKRRPVHSVPTCVRCPARGEAP